MKHKNTQKLTLAAMTAAAYAALSLLGAVFGLTFGPIQVRFSEALCLLPFLFPETAWGLGVGCLIANLFSPYGALDIVVGSLSTLIAALLTARCRSPWTAALPPVVCNMVLVGAVLAYETAGTSAAFWPAYGLNALTVGLGEAIACLVLGVLLVKQQRPVLGGEAVLQDAVDEVGFSGVQKTGDEIYRNVHRRLLTGRTGSSGRPPSAGSR